MPCAEVVPDPSSVDHGLDAGKDDGFSMDVETRIPVAAIVER